jgi:3-isopropylmalate/(R)-2-methylmalate dehydratase small subunit
MATPGAKSREIVRIEGRAVAVRGDNIDTDRIIPARFLLCVTFDGLGEHAFEDDRKALAEKGRTHPFDNPRHQGASILVVNRNFGSGSSREHAPQSLQRWGIRTVIGESFAEIFFGNCQALGLPCITAPKGDVETLQKHVEANPAGKVALDLSTLVVSWGDRNFHGHMPSGPRDAFIRGTWDVTGLLLDGPGEVEAVAARLPYLRGF